MAVRIAANPAAGAQAAKPSAPQLTGAMAAALLQAGFAGSPEAGARTLLGALAAKGFKSALGTLGQKLGQAVAQFQRANGLQVTGNLDAQTINLLSQLGLIPRDANAPPVPLGLLQHKDGYDGKKLEQQLQKATQDMTPQQQAEVQQAFSQVMKNFLQAPKRALELVLSMLGLAAGKGAEEGGASHTQADPTAAPPQALAEGASAQGRADGTGMSKSKANGQSKTSGKDQVRAKPGVKDNLDRGAEDGEDDAGKDGGDNESGRGGGDGGGPNEDGTFGTGAEEGDGTELDQGNATSGDDDWRQKAGHAQTGDEDAGAGHYEIPSVADQVRRGLTEIYVDIAPGAAKATTYTWEVELFRPGVYGPGQKAEVVFKLRVERATAFDRVWTKASEKLNEFQLRFDDQDEGIEPEDVLVAIRQARFRR